MTRLNRMLSRVADALFYVAMLAGALMMIHVTVDVVSRTVFHHPLPGTGEITATYYMIAVAFLPLAWVTLRDQHVSADLFVAFMPDGMRKGSEIFVELLSIAYVGAFVWQTWVSAMAKTRRAEVWEIFGGYLPIWPTRWLLPVAGTAMVLVLLLRLAERLTSPTTPMTETE
ncbi:TRAP transporter small permease [Oceanicola sp. S124]|uniref:TRAP transporter small permease n=1 Tax=Oceanicola sp. S124 TaxID=1042378 RepID=UPI000255A977|nr:TRAP transporter small permease [Oceanicola sp. S124]